MKVKILKICSGCGFSKLPWKREGPDLWCRDCWNSKLKYKRSVQKHKDRIPPTSSKKRKLDYAYSILRKRFLLDYPMCHAKIDARCQLKSSDIHHKAGRTGSYHLDTRFWLPVCRPCHMWIENNPEKAKELGLSLDRISENHGT